MRTCEGLVVKQFYQGLLPRRNRNKNRAGFFHCGEREEQHRLRRNINRRSGEDMKITALLVLKVSGAAGSSETAVLANASDVSQFGFFQRQSAREFIVFASRTIAGRTPLGQRQSVSQDEYMVHCYNRNGLCGLAFVDKEYPMRSAFSVINKVLDEYQTTFGNTWQTKTTDSTDPWPYLPDALTKFQNPTEADKLLKIQRDLDETKVILHKTIDSVLARGERLDSLVDKSTDLSMASQVFYKQAKKANQCCTIL